MTRAFLIAITMAATTETATAGTSKTTAVATADVAPQAKSGKAKLFLDVHDVGAGKVTAAAVADGHKKDLAAQGKYGVHFKAYWLDEKQGRIYCLAEAPSAEAIVATHKEAHGLLPDTIEEVTEGR